MKTAVIYTDFTALPYLFVVDEDWTRFDKLIIGAVQDSEEQSALADELVDLMFDTAGNLVFTPYHISDVPTYFWWDEDMKFISIGQIP